jgi:hypothetical protein
MRSISPHAVEGVRTGDVVEVVSSTDSDAEGRTLAVVSVTFGTFGASRRLTCEEQEPGVHQFVPEVTS